MADLVMENHRNYGAWRKICCAAGWRRTNKGTGLYDFIVSNGKQFRPFTEIIGTSYHVVFVCDPKSRLQVVNIPVTVLQSIQSEEELKAFQLQCGECN